MEDKFGRKYMGKPRFTAHKSIIYYICTHIHNLGTTVMFMHETIRITKSFSLIISVKFLSVPQTPPTAPAIDMNTVIPSDAAKHTT